MFLDFSISWSSPAWWSRIFCAGAFLVMHAPDVAISEVAVGAALTPLVLIVALKKMRGGDD